MLTSTHETRNGDCVHMTACGLTLQKYSIRFWPQIMELFASEYQKFTD